MAELRQIVPLRMSFAEGSPAAMEAPRPTRRPAARAALATGRVLLRLLAAVAAALSGLVFVILLPICGIATLAEGFGKACWQTARGAAPRDDRGVVPHR